ncbi:hypothetical protein CPC16_007067 [Podila verticillata]|nr:hypothetical protein BGZ52_010388 [Haplosporangium bisporale]KAF9214762.1 hypothetical protein BGZ59_003060 [Podila verticillata]KAF9387405.1 hypothetical protein CPC16_007067 [Podila verticillata]KAI9239234.1 MAG: hypothetical protein BYD32DRAFT_411899 [Podila humilis]KFH66942.1 hypothetical protein MVEG_07466 [Podila verticillata NRRL 6337]
MIKSILALGALAASVSAQALDHISFTQPVGDGITYVAGTNQTFSWTMPCTGPNRSLYSETPNATEVDFMDSNNIDNAFYVKKVGTIDCTKPVGNLVWTVPADTKPGVYALQLLLRPNNAYSGRFNVTAPGSGSTGSGSTTGGSSGTGVVTASASGAMTVSPVIQVMAIAAAGAAALSMIV